MAAVVGTALKLEADYFPAMRPVIPSGKALGPALGRMPNGSESLPKASKEARRWRFFTAAPAEKRRSETPRLLQRTGCSDLLVEGKD
ncbi:MAG: hypothetical protein ACLVHV_12320 [Oscillospiraceae bacterium]